MTRLLLLLVLLLAPVAARAVSDPAELLPNPAQEARAEAIGSQLRCLVCQNESIEDSGAGLARDLRQVVRAQVASGKSNRQVIAWMVERYGSFIRLRPPLTGLTFLLWAMPVLALATGLLAALHAARLDRRARRAPPAPLSRAERRRLTDLLEPP